MAEKEHNPFELNNLHRQISVNIMLGIVEAVDNTTGRVTVNINEKKLHNLKVIAQRAGGNGKLWWLPAKGEQVILLSPFGNLTDALVLGSIYYGKSDAENEFKTGLPEDLNSETEPSAIRKIYYPDGSSHSYDSENHEYIIAIKEKDNSEEKTKIRLFANKNEASGLEITIGNTKISAYNQAKTEGDDTALLLEKGDAKITIQHDESIFLTAKKNIELTADTIKLVAKNVNVIEK